MARNVFISFRYSDGNKYKNDLAELFKESNDTVDCSEEVDRSMMSEDTIQDYLYKKLKRSSVTIVLLTPESVFHKKNSCGKYDDWMYDEIRYSLEDRINNRTNGLIAVYVPEAEYMIIHKTIHICNVCNNQTEIDLLSNFDNLSRLNMLNVKEEYKVNRCDGVYDGDYDSYCSLVPYNEFKKNFEKYIEIAIQKREEKYKYDVRSRLQ